MDDKLVTSSVDCCIVGGGPGGAMLALLLARQNVRVKLLEAHQDFEREFRGDTVHLSTQLVLAQLGLGDRLRQLPQAQVTDFPVHYPDGHLSAPVAMKKREATLLIPQARLIELLVEEARRYPNFSIEFGARAEGLIRRDGIVRGVRYRTSGGSRSVQTQLVVGADGRFSKVRQLVGLELVAQAASIDVLWFKLPRQQSDPERAHGLYVGGSDYLVILPRDDGWQIGFVFPKGSYARLRSEGIDSLRASIANRAPFLADRVQLIADWRQLSLLQVASARIPSWHVPGVLLIGDAAHVMSPVAGVGINYAIQDAVVAANVLGRHLLDATLESSHFAAVQRRRELPTRLMQALQARMEPGTTGSNSDMPRLMRLAPVQAVIRRLIAFGGFWPERVRERPDDGWSRKLIWGSPTHDMQPPWSDAGAHS